VGGRLILGWVFANCNQCFCMVEEWIYIVGQCRKVSFLTTFCSLTAESTDSVTIYSMLLRNFSFFWLHFLLWTMPRMRKIFLVSLRLFLSTLILQVTLRLLKLFYSPQRRLPLYFCYWLSQINLLVSLTFVPSFFGSEVAAHFSRDDAVFQHSSF